MTLVSMTLRCLAMFPDGGKLSLAILREETSMSFRTWASALAFSMFALVITVTAQAPGPVQTRDSDVSALRLQAEAGEAQAEFALGNRYLRCICGPQDCPHALLWYRKASEQGCA